MFFWHRRISIIIVSSSRHLQRSVSPAEILHPLEASDTHSQAPPGWLTGRRDQARMLTNVVSPIIHLYWGWCINYLSIYLYIYIFGFTTLHTNTYKHIPTCSESFRWCVSGWKKSKVAPGIQQKPAPQTYQFIQKDLQTLPM